MLNERNVAVTVGGCVAIKPEWFKDTDPEWIRVRGVGFTRRIRARQREPSPATAPPPGLPRPDMWFGVQGFCFPL